MDILGKIELLKKQRGWTEYKLSVESAVSQSTISGWYNMGRSPTVASLEKICTAFGITLSQFFADENEMVDLTKEQRIVLERWSALNKNQQEALLNVMQSIPTELE